MAPQFVEDLIDRMGEAKSLDKVAEPLSKGISAIVPHGPLKDLLSGTWLGHPLHPMLTDVAIGSWTSAFVLDVFGHEAAESSADALVGFGVVSALPTALSGFSDWSDLMHAERRIGLAHALANAGAIGFYGLSWLARRKGDRSRGLALSLLGATVATVGGYLGGHLAYRNGVNVDRNAWKELPGDWVPVLDAAGLEDGKPALGSADGVDVVVVKQGDSIHALAEVCGHAGGPLHEGEVDGGCVICPWHGSTFRLDDGAAVHGPATAPQPAFDVRVHDGKVLVRARP